MTDLDKAADAAETRKIPASKCRPGPLAAELRVAILRAARRIRAERGPAELSAGQYAVLAHLDNGGPLNARELADLECVRPPSMTRILASLEELDLITRAENPGDRRQNMVYITEKGKAEVKDTRRRRTEWLAARIAMLPAADRQTLAKAATILQEVTGR